MLNIVRATGVTDFARRPTVAGVPILAESDGDARYVPRAEVTRLEQRIATLEARLAQLEART